ncbi:WXG100 family type VII secretion target [Nocardia altamirensis]|uniref:WXG100 family type VII secretion target n=1 Tax=Nocardia altamirensis TaxID=472158 RepID=UPI00083FEE39|nr:WXG100 family type VII secretion target [Nocardia altamirensis]
MSAEFKVDLDELDNIVSRLKALAGFVTGELDQLDEGVAALPGIWESIGSQAYTEAHGKWASGAREFAGGVAEMSAAAQAAHHRYTSALQTNRRMLRGR